MFQPSIFRGYVSFVRGKLKSTTSSLKVSMFSWFEVQEMFNYRKGLRVSNLLGVETCEKHRHQAMVCVQMNGSLGKRETQRNIPHRDLT